jgi:hypothetical protein
VQCKQALAVASPMMLFFSGVNQLLALNYATKSRV